jgi:hypothetical protein
MPDKKYIEDHPYISYSKPILTDEDMLEQSKSFYDFMDNRRSVREFSDRAVPREVVENLIKTARHSGNSQTTWTFVVWIRYKKTDTTAAKKKTRKLESRMSGLAGRQKPLGQTNKPF